MRNPTSATSTDAPLPELDPAPELDHRGPGRPRDESADSSILAAAVALLQEGGAEHLTVSAVVARSSVARATVYRRFPSRELLLAAAIREVKGRPPYPLSGNLETDLRRAAEQARAILAAPQFQAVLPALVQDVLLEEAATGVSDAWDRIAPNHRRFAAEYAERAAAAGLRPEIDGYVAGNVVIGSLLAVLLSTGRPPSRATADQVVDVVLNGLRAR
jgi:AcrR family transcriptional regulator